MLSYMLLILLVLGIIFFIIGGNKEKTIKWMGVLFISVYLVYTIPSLIILH
ncbi:hypothetical protein SAMN02745163_02429 [Clostridium cavendishii DSM 21758]|uniref:Uncharacterized protein n=1 Tax=Clostridium cavendishii DSM 21758 TaxID=1121302 RepID=A0A1M6LMC5_9CLOT|nr:hypothetical protein SAMN02745163_02429 [Clostridium cavendishii DSM 21758]